MISTHWQYLAYLNSFFQGHAVRVDQEMMMFLYLAWIQPKKRKGYLRKKNLDKNLTISNIVIKQHAITDQHTDKPWKKHHAERKKPDTKCHIPYDSIYEILRIRRFTKRESKFVASLEWDREHGEWPRNGYRGSLLGDKKFWN